VAQDGAREGRFNPKESNAKGVIKAKGACNSGKQHWAARKQI
jgi:hypothetical protein